MNAAEKLPKNSYPESGIDVIIDDEKELSELNIPVTVEGEENDEPDSSDNFAGMTPAEIMKSDARSGFPSIERSAPASKIESIADLSHHATFADEEKSAVSGVRIVDLGEHVQELSEDSDLMETLRDAIEAAKSTGEPAAFITCEQEGDSMCIALEKELETRKERGTIFSYSKQPMSGRIGFRIVLERPVTQNDIDEEDSEDLAA